MNPSLIKATHISGSPGSIGQFDLSHFAPWFDASFGPARTCSVGVWSGDSYSYSVLMGVMDTFNKGNVLIRHQDGSGVYYYIDCHPQIDFWRMICASPEPRRWDFCHMVCGSVQGATLQSAQREREAIYQAFAEGRLTKRKVRGQAAYEVSVKPLDSSAAAVVQ